MDIKFLLGGTQEFKMDIKFFLERAEDYPEHKAYTADVLNQLAMPKVLTAIILSYHTATKWVLAHKVEDFEYFPPEDDDTTGETTCENRTYAKILYTGAFYRGRDRLIFAAIAGVNNIVNGYKIIDQPIAQKRGLPSDISEATLAFYQAGHSITPNKSQWHNETWISFKEAIDLNDNFYKRHVNPALYTSLCIVSDSYRHMIASMLGWQFRHSIPYDQLRLVIFFSH